MKETRYRGWTIDTKREAKGYYCQVEGKYYIILDDAEYDNCTPVNENYQPAIGGFIEVDPETVGQFIGIRDKNNKKIYGAVGKKGGDVVDFDNSDIGGEKYRGEIVWCDDQTLGNLEWGLWTKKGYLHTDFLGSIEVIGTVAKNPELLKG